jgi:hypothetical protein
MKYDLVDKNNLNWLASVRFRTPINIDVDIVTDIGCEQHLDVYKPRPPRTSIPSKISRFQTPYVLDHGREGRAAQNS